MKKLQIYILAKIEDRISKINETNPKAAVALGYKLLSSKSITNEMRLKLIEGMRELPQNGFTKELVRGNIPRTDNNVEFLIQKFINRYKNKPRHARLLIARIIADPQTKDNFKFAFVYLRYNLSDILQTDTEDSQALAVLVDKFNEILNSLSTLEEEQQQIQLTEQSIT